MKKLSLRTLLPLVFLLVLAAVLITGFQNAEQAEARRAKATLEESLKRAALSCYAIEGSYPDTLEHLTEHYQVHVDEERFAVIYEVFAGNIMPTITVLERQAAS